MTFLSKNVLFTTIVFVSVLSGCMTPFSPTQTESPTEFYQGTARMYFWNESADPYHVNLSVSLETRGVPQNDEPFENVMFCMYDEDGDVIESINMGRMNKSGDAVDIIIYTNESMIENRGNRFVDVYRQINQTPSSYFPYHPQFESFNIVNNARVHSSGRTTGGMTIDAFPYQPPEEQGTCQIANRTSD